MHRLKVFLFVSFLGFNTTTSSAQLTTTEISEIGTNSQIVLPQNEMSHNHIATNSTQFRQNESNLQPIRIRKIVVDEVPCRTNSSVQCETEHIFKRPTSGMKRKLLSENPTIRKRTCQKRNAVKPKNLQSTSTSIASNDRVVSSTLANNEMDESTLNTEEPDSSLVEDILRYYKMPKFIDTITDPDHVIEVMKRLNDDDGKAAAHSNESQEESMGSESMSIDSSSTQLNDVLATYDEFESPASPPQFNEEPTSYQEPLIIPIAPKTLHSSVVKDILANFDKRKRLAVSQRKYKLPTTAEEQILTTTRCRIEKYLLSEWDVETIEACCNDLSHARPGILSKCFVEVVMSTKNENLSSEFTPPAPALPKTHQKITVLIKRIGRLVNGFEDLVLFQLEKTMFVLTEEKLSIAEAMNLTHLFIALTDCMDEEAKSSCVLFAYKCLYYFAIKSIPMVHSVLMAYPTILPQFPKFQESDNVTEFFRNTTNILQATLAIVLINTNLSESNVDGKCSSGLKKRELSTILRSYYNFSCMHPTVDDFVDILVNHLTNGSNLDDISYSLILLAKRNGTVWADDMIQRKLLPQLNRFLQTISNGTENDERIKILVSAISSIVKTYPTIRDISNYQQIFYKILDATTRQTIQEEAVMALLRTSRFGMVNVYKRISDWQPRNAVSRQCYAMLNTFLYRQNLSYWQNF